MLFRSALGGQIVDATVVPAPKQRNTEEEKAVIKEGRIPPSAGRTNQLTDAKWRVVSSYLPAEPPRGLPRRWQGLCDAILFVLRTGAPWRCLQPGFTPWQTVYRWFARLRDRGCFQNLDHPLRSRCDGSRQAHRTVSMSYETDSQSLQALIKPALRWQA